MVLGHHTPTRIQRMHFARYLAELRDVKRSMVTGAKLDPTTKGLVDMIQHTGGALLCDV